MYDFDRQFIFDYTYEITVIYILFFRRINRCVGSLSDVIPMSTAYLLDWIVCTYPVRSGNLGIYMISQESLSPLCVDGNVIVVYFM